MLCMTPGLARPGQREATSYQPRCLKILRRDRAHAECFLRPRVRDRRFRGGLCNGGCIKARWTFASVIIASSAAPETNRASLCGATPNGCRGCIGAGAFGHLLVGEWVRRAGGRQRRDLPVGRCHGGAPTCPPPMMRLRSATAPYRRPRQAPGRAPAWSGQARRRRSAPLSPQTRSAALVCTLTISMITPPTSTAATDARRWRSERRGSAPPAGGPARVRSRGPRCRSACTDTPARPWRVASRHSRRSEGIRTGRG
jgi:hypothetical protein